MLKKLYKRVVRFAKYFRTFNLGKSYGRFKYWRGAKSSPRIEIERSLKLMVARSRELCQNNNLAIRAKRKYGSALIGTGILPNFSNPIIDKELKRWKPDFDEKETLQGLFRLAVYTVFESGSCFLLKRHGDPVAVQILEPDYLDVTKNNLEDTRNGIVYDSFGRVKGYWLYASFPGDYQNIKNALESFFVSVSICKLVFWQERPGTQIGTPFLAQVGDSLKDIEEYNLAEIARRKVAACFSAFIYDVDAAFDSEGEYDDAANLEKLSPGRIEVLPPGKRIEFANPPTPQDSSFLETRLRDVSSGLNLTYESLTGDFSKVNFSSSRMSRQEQDEFFEQLQSQFVIPRICKPILDWFVEGLFSYGIIDSLKVDVDWTVPRKPFIQPLQDVTAIEKQISIGLTTPSEAVRAMGKDPETHWDKYRKDVKNLKDLDIGGLNNNGRGKETT